MNQLPAVAEVRQDLKLRRGADDLKVTHDHNEPEPGCHPVPVSASPFPEVLIESRPDTG